MPWTLMDTEIASFGQGAEMNQIYYVTGSADGDVKVRFRIHADTTSTSFAVAEIFREKWEELAHIPYGNIRTDGHMVHTPNWPKRPITRQVLTEFARREFEEDRQRLLWLSDLILQAGGERK